MASVTLPERRTVVVIGGGLAGLSASESLLRPGHARLRGDGTTAELDASPSAAVPEVIVLEASGRVGGRTASTKLQSAPAVVDIGGQWIGANQPATLQVAQEAGVTLAPQYCSGRRVLQIGSSIASYTGLIPSISAAAVLDAQIAIWKLKFLQVGQGAWRTQCFRRWRWPFPPSDSQLLLWCCPASWWVHRWADSTAMAAWVDRAVWTTAAKALIRIVVQAFTGLEPDAVSVLAFCRYVNQNDTVEAMTEIGEGSLQVRRG